MHSPTFPVVRLPMLETVTLPLLMRVAVPQPRGEPIPDVDSAVDSALAGLKRLDGLSTGARIAIGVGSRGIAHLPRVVARTAAFLKGKGLQPFIVPAMGSHGGGTAEGQAAMLAQLGVSEAAVGAPVGATMEVVEYGRTEQGIPCCLDRNAAEADGVIVIGRVKSHTSFDRPIESGLVKMVAVGLGKVQGAHHVHRLGPRGLSEVLPRIAAISIAHAPFVGGLALVENAHKDFVAVEGVEPENFFEADQRLLKLAKSMLARLPFDRLDALIVEWIGKEISGAGMDYAVTGRTDIRGVPNPPTPLIHKVGVLGVTPESRGNGVGVGMANFITREVAEGLDLMAMYTNSVTAAITEKAFIPIVLPDERDLVRACVKTGWSPDPAEARLCVIRSTLHLNEMLVSPSLYAEVKGCAGVEVLEDSGPIRFGEDGRLLNRLSGRNGPKP